MGSPPARAPEDPPFVQLEGHIAFQSPRPWAGGITEFYIGRSYAQVDGVDVFNWRNPLCRLFFDSNPTSPQVENFTGNGAPWHHRNSAVRTFHHQNGVIVDFVDDLFCEPYPNHCSVGLKVRSTQGPQPLEPTRTEREQFAAESVPRYGPAGTDVTVQASSARTQSSRPPSHRGSCGPNGYFIDHLRAPRKGPLHRYWRRYNRSNIDSSPLILGEA